MTFNNEISVITISGLLGIINYWIFYQLDLFNFFNNKNSDEKGTLIVLLGLVNIVSFQLISNNTEFHIIFVIIISLILSIAVELFVLYSIKRISEFIISNYFKNVKSYKVFENSLESLFEENSDKELFVYIYDFNDKLIDYGYVDSYTYENNENNIILALSNDYEIFKETRDIEELDYDKVFIDFDRKIKIYPFIVGDSREEDIDKLQNNDREQYIREVEKEDLLRIHENVMFWIENCDNKTSIILGVVGIILTIFLTSDSLSNLVNNIEESITNMNWLNFIYLIAVLLTILFLAISITFLVKVLISNTNPETIDKKDIKTNSLLHFESINKIESNDEYIEKIKATDKDDYLRDLTSQIMINSHITTIKFRNYNIGVKFLAKTIILLFISVILSYTIFLVISFNVRSEYMDFGSYDYEERKQQVEEILDNTNKVETKRKFPKEDEFTYTNGYKAYATAIFVDIRNSTELFSTDNEEEKLEASKVVRGFTSEIIEILRQNTEEQLEEIGVRGDCVYAIYSTPITDDIYDVWSRGVYINTYMKMYNKLLSKRNLPNIKAGIGMATAETVAVKAGRKSSGINGIVWIGKAVSIASKLSDLANNGSYDPLLISSTFHYNLKKPYIQKQSEEKFNNFFEKKYESNIGEFYQASVVKTGFDEWIDKNL